MVVTVTFYEIPDGDFTGIEVRYNNEIYNNFDDTDEDDAECAYWPNQQYEKAVSVDEFQALIRIFELKLKG